MADARCSPRGARVLASRGQVAVYRTGKGRIRACNAQRNDVTLANEDLKTLRFSGEAIARAPVLRIRGNFIAYVYVLIDGDLESVTVQLLNLADPTPRPQVTEAGFKGFEKVASLRLTIDGTIAWIACWAPPQLINGKGKACYRTGRRALVIKARPVGHAIRLREEILDRGQTITPSSLRLRGRTLTWRKAGRRQTAQL